MTIYDAMAAGQRGMEQAWNKAAREIPLFTERAMALMLQYLSGVGGRAAGEDITFYVRSELKCKGQALGPVYIRLQAEGAIRCTRIDLPRRYGHASIGGKEWSLVKGVKA